MINKDKTIKKAVSKYHTIFPVRGKRSIEECFFCLRGEYFFTFRTKDKKVHTMRADEARPVSTSTNSNRVALDSILKVLNKPIIVRSLIIKKPVGTWLINLFPVPGISWSSNIYSSSGTIRAHQSNRPVMGYGTAKPSTDWTPALNETSDYSYPPPYPVSNGQGRAPNRFSDQRYPLPGDTTTHQYEILATGYLPARPSTDWMLSPDENLKYSHILPHPVPNGQKRAPKRFTDQRNPLPCDATTYHYEVLATGYLPARPSTDWIPSLDETSEYSYTPLHQVSNGQGRVPKRFPDKRSLPPGRD